MVNRRIVVEDGQYFIETVGIGMGWNPFNLNEELAWIWSTPDMIIAHEATLFQEKGFSAMIDYFDCPHAAYDMRDAIRADLPLLAAFFARIISPLTIDLDGDGVELIALEDSAAFFDLDVDGYAQNTGWVSADNALLALDVDGDGIIDDGSELFGNEINFVQNDRSLTRCQAMWSDCQINLYLSYPAQSA